jgi:U3 small nucleolar RNA-associated protein MPP10
MKIKRICFLLVEVYFYNLDLATGDFEEEDEENANDIKYSDFFESTSDPKKRRKSWKDDMEEQNTINRPAEVEKEHEEEKVKNKSLFDDEEIQPEESKMLSKFELEQLAIQKEIEQLEAENMGAKEWTMKGEVNSKSRPINSLLEQELDVDIAAKPPPVITEETTQTLESLIMQRIKDNAFDDVVRKAPIKKSTYDPNRRFELNDEKSKKSLAEIYEEEYQNTQEKVKSRKDIELEKQHQEIETLFHELRDQLDSLSNFHYQPRAKTLELAV